MKTVDRFGQYVPGEWPEKARSEEQLQAAWREGEETLEAGEFGFCSFGGFSGTRARATGFFRVEEIDGIRWR